MGPFLLMFLSIHCWHAAISICAGDLGYEIRKDELQKPSRGHLEEVYLGRPGAYAWSPEAYLGRLEAYHGHLKADLEHLDAYLVALNCYFTIYAFAFVIQNCLSASRGLVRGV